MKYKLPTLLAAGLVAAAASLHSPPTHASGAGLASIGFEIISMGITGNVGVWVFELNGIYIGVSAATEAEAIAILTGSGHVGSWTLVTLGPVGGTVGAGSAAGGATGGTVAGGSVAGTIGTVVAVVGVAVVATVAIDCAMNGECIWTSVGNAGGVGAVFGPPKPGNVQIPDAVTVNCRDPRPMLAQCRDTSLRNNVTTYYSWSLGRYWTCGDIWANGATTGDAAWMNALRGCNIQVENCIAHTANVCQANHIVRPDLKLQTASAD